MTKPLTKRGSRNKGLAFERELIAYFKDRLGIEAARGVAGAQAFNRSKGSTDLFGVPELAVEAKRTETFKLDTFMAQAVRNASGGDMPVIIHRKSRQAIGHATVALRLEDFARLYEAYLELKGFKLPLDRTTEELFQPNHSQTADAER